MEYKIEDYKLYNERTSGGILINDNFIYKMERSFSTEEKIKFIDENYEFHGHKGLCTYMLELINKYLVEKDNLPKDCYGYVKTVSLKAWLKKNDIWELVDNRHLICSYRFANREYSDFATLTPRPTWGSSAPYYNQEGRIVDLWFHDVLDILYNKEKEYFNDHNPLVQKIRKIQEYGKIYGCFEIKKIGIVVGNGIRILDNDWRRAFKEPMITEEEIDKMLKVYEDYDKFIKAKTKEIQDNLGWDIMEN